MSLSSEWGSETLISCDGAFCAIPGERVRDHEHLGVAKGDPRLDARLEGWALDIDGNDIDICPECLEAGYPLAPAQRPR